MTPIRRGKAGTFALYVARRSGGVVLRSTGTTDKIVYNGMKRMLAELKSACCAPSRTASVPSTNLACSRWVLIHIIYASLSLA